MRVVISNGSNRFHLAPLAAEMARTGVLCAFLTAGWPSGSMRWLAERFPKSAAWQRLLDRAEPIPDSLVHSFGRTELLFRAGDKLAASWPRSLQRRLHRAGFRAYAASAKRVIKAVAPDVYHYRSCYGLGSVAAARAVGAITLCDQSIAHPICLEWMVANAGAYPPKNRFAEIRGQLVPLNLAMEQDLERADYVLVNSEFVRDTCVYAGMDGRRIHVVYTGVDDGFLSALDSAPRTKQDSVDSLLFAGGLQGRKGVSTLMDAMNGADFRWRLEIVGSSEVALTRDPRVTAFVSRPEVELHGLLPQSDLAALMKRHRLFVFPSYAEGSARVVFMALAAGCYVITTPNSGSIVQDGVHGALVPPADAVALRRAIEEALDDPTRIETIGRANADLIREAYLQRHYGEKVMQVYQGIHSQRLQAR